MNPLKPLSAKLIRLEGRIDLLVNNAGFGVAPAGAEESSIEQARSIFETNFFGIVRMTRAVVPHMRRQGSGRIINIGSVLGFLPMPYGALYAATKHAIEGYSESLDHELRTRGIRVSIIEPAYTKTPFDANFLEPDAKLDEYREIRAAVNQRVKEVMATAERAGRRGRRRAESGQCGSPETPIRGRRAREPPAIATQICACWPGGRRDSKRSAARRGAGRENIMKAFIVDRYERKERGTDRRNCQSRSCGTMGVVVRVGSAVRQFKPGDEVYVRADKDRIGTFAEFIAMNEDAVAIKPKDHHGSGLHPSRGLDGVASVIRTSEKT